MKNFIATTLLLIALSANICHAQPGISSDGREYYIAMPTPSLLWQANSNAGANFLRASLLITSLGNNNVTVSYFTSNGTETNAQIFHLLPHNSVTVSLDPNQLKTTINGETPEYKVCHIVSQSPISVQFLSVGGCGGGSYQALPLQCLGRKYTVMSYHDNVNGLGGIYNQASSAGFAMIVAPYDATTIEITPTSTTAGGHIGYKCGTTPLPTQPPSFVINLNRGQCYFIKSAATESSCDFSETSIISTKPIVVIAGHENAYTDGSDVGDGGFDQRDLMVEQMMPVECFDTAGYYVAPLLMNGTDISNGDELHTFSNGTSSSLVTMSTNGKNGIPMNTSPFQNPPSAKVGSAVPVSFYSLNGKPFSVMLYDQRSQISNFYPSPSMISIIPRSRWKSEYAWKIEKAENSALFGNYLNMICKASDWNSGSIKISINGGSPVSINSAFSVKKTWPLLAGSDLIGVTFSANVGSYYAWNTFGSGFTICSYGWQVWDPDRDPPEEHSFYYSYGTTLGMTYSEFGVPKPGFSVSVLDDCNRWKVCVTDSGAASNGIRYIELLNYQNNSIFPAPDQATGVSFDNISDPLSKGEIVLDGTAKEFCFFVLKKSEQPHAVIAVYDNSGDRFMIDIDRPSPKPIASSTGDLVQQKDTLFEFIAPHIDTIVCGSIVIKNSDPTGPIDLQITQISLPKDSAFKLTSPLPVLPFTLHKNQSINLNFCFTPKDTLIRTTSMQIATSCPEYFTYLLRGRGTEAFIDATDITFSDIKPLAEQCKPVTISNVGTYPFKVTSYSLDNRASFTLDLSFVASLPIVIQPGASVKADICFHPQEYGTHSGRIEWLTDLGDNAKIKSYSLLSGMSKEPSSAVESIDAKTREFSVRSVGNRLAVTTPTGITQASFILFDLLGRHISDWENQQSADGFVSLSAPKLPEGVYILRMKAGADEKSCLVLIQ